MTRAEKFVKEAERIRKREVEAMETLSEIRRTRKSLQLKNGAGSVMAYVNDTNGDLEIPGSPSSGGIQSPRFTASSAKQLAQWILDTFIDKEEF